MKKIFITGGAGFIGSAVIRNIINHTNYNVINIDSLTYAGNLSSLKSVDSNSRYRFENINICNYESIMNAFTKYKPDAIMHLAAESHVDRSIDSPYEFIQTNILGTYNLLEAARKYWKNLSNKQQNIFRFHHISTDEVYGDLDFSDDAFIETTPYSPSSPYSASKASSDHLVRAWARTYDLPTIITNCSNNYGPYHFPEKLIPRVILNAINGKSIPIFGNGSQIRDWLFVEDHANALLKVITEGAIGETYNIGGNNEKSNLEVVQTICHLLEDYAPEKPSGISKYHDLITFVKDRPGHDLRYAINASKIKNELGWVPQETFESGLKKTVQWYLENKTWWQKILSGSYRSDVNS